MDDRYDYILTALEPNPKTGYLRPSTLPSSNIENNLRSRSSGIENLARDLEDLTTSTTSSDSAPHSTDSPNRPLTPRSDTGTSRTRKNGGSTPNLDPDGGPFRTNGRTERNKSFGGIRRNQQRESPSLSRPIPLPPTLPNVNITIPTDTGSTTGDTVVNTGRKLPSPPSHIPTNSSNEVNISGEGWKHAGRQDRPVSFEMAIKGESNSSGSTTGPETDRSMPYYEVPSSSVPYVHGKNSTTH